jgi:hypothetical protein
VGAHGASGSEGSSDTGVGIAAPIDLWSALRSMFRCSSISSWDGLLVIAYQTRELRKGSGRPADQGFSAPSFVVGRRSIRQDRALGAIWLPQGGADSARSERHQIREVGGRLGRLY